MDVRGLYCIACAKSFRFLESIAQTLNLILVKCTALHLYYFDNSYFHLPAYASSTQLKMTVDGTLPVSQRNKEVPYVNKRLQSTTEMFKKENEDPRAKEIV